MPKICDDPTLGQPAKHDHTRGNIELFAYGLLIMALAMSGAKQPMLWSKQLDSKTNTDLERRAAV